MREGDKYRERKREKVMITERLDRKIIKRNNERQRDRENQKKNYEKIERQRR